MYDSYEGEKSVSGIDGRFSKEVFSPAHEIFIYFNTSLRYNSEYLLLLYTSLHDLGLSFVELTECRLCCEPSVSI